MLNRKRLMLVSVAVLLVVGTATAIVIATSDDSDTPITGDALGRASAAALEYTGGGTVTDTEIGDEEGYYEVEVTMKDGTEVDVHLDSNFKVISSGTDKDDETEDTRN
jgi:uncharacterized membrane protein YkoI